MDTLPEEIINNITAQLDARARLRVSTLSRTLSRCALRNICFNCASLEGVLFGRSTLCMMLRRGLSGTVDLTATCWRLLRARDVTSAFQKPTLVRQLSVGAYAMLTQAQMAAIAPHVELDIVHVRLTEDAPLPPAKRLFVHGPQYFERASAAARGISIRSGEPPVGMEMLQHLVVGTGPSRPDKQLISLMCEPASQAHLDAVIGCTKLETLSINLARADVIQAAVAFNSFSPHLKTLEVAYFGRARCIMNRGLLSLRLKDCGFVDMRVLCVNLPSLTRLMIQNTHISNMESIQFANIEHLELIRYSFYETVSIQWLTRLPLLRVLDISNTISDGIDAVLPLLPHLHTLRATKSGMKSQAIAQALRSHSSLTNLSIGGNELQAIGVLSNRLVHFQTPIVIRRTWEFLLDEGRPANRLRSLDLTTVLDLPHIAGRLANDTPFVERVTVSGQYLDQETVSAICNTRSVRLLVIKGGRVKKNPMRRLFFLSLIVASAAAAPAYVLMLADGAPDWAALRAALPAADASLDMQPQGSESASIASGMATGCEGPRRGVSLHGIPLGLQAAAKGLPLAAVSDVCVLDATVAAFFARAPDRYEAPAVAASLRAAGLAVMLGGTSALLQDECSGDCCVSDAAALASTACRAGLPLVGSFGDPKDQRALECAPLPFANQRPDSTPGLRAMAESVVRRLGLARPRSGGFVVVATDLLDRAAHAGDAEAAAATVADFAAAVAYVREALAGRDDALLVVTGDHETPMGGVEHADGTVPVLLYGRLPSVQSPLHSTDFYKLFAFASKTSCEGADGAARGVSPAAAVIVVVALGSAVALLAIVARSSMRRKDAHE